MNENGKRFGPDPGQTVVECWEQREGALGRPASLLVSPTCKDSRIAVVPRHQAIEPLVILQWLSRPDEPFGPRLLGIEADGKGFLVLHHGVDDQGRIRVSPIQSSPASGIPEGLQGMPSLAVDATGSGVWVVQQNELSSRLVFAVVVIEEAPETARSPQVENASPGVLEHPSDIYSAAYLRLLDHTRGAPIDAIWHFNWEIGGIRWLVLNSDSPAPYVEHVPYRQTLSREDFQRCIVSAIEAAGTRVGIMLLVSREGRGHCVTIHGLNKSEGRILFDDFWPGRSLLCAENTGGVAAAKLEPGGRHKWSITIDELGRVGVGALLEVTHWAKICGVDYALALGTALGGDFGRFFRVTETSREVQADGRTLVSLQTGGFRDKVGLGALVGDGDVVQKVFVRVRRDWLVRDGTPFACDLLKGFLGAFVPGPDRGEANAIIDAIRMMQRGGSVSEVEQKLKSGPAHLVAQQLTVFRALVGVTPFGRIMLPFVTIRGANVRLPNSEDFELSVSLATTELGPLWEDAKSGYEMTPERVQLVKPVAEKLQLFAQAH